MRAAVLGGGPGGLNFCDHAEVARSIARRCGDRAQLAERHIWLGRRALRRNAGNLHTNDPVSSKAIRDSFVYWDDIAVHYCGTVMRSGGHGFRALAASGYSISCKTVRNRWE